jgi:glutamate synthase (NADPH) large chain
MIDLFRCFEEGFDMTQEISTGITRPKTNGETSKAVKPFAFTNGFAPQGMYTGKSEHDACGVGFIADMKGRRSHQIIVDGLAMLENLTHRGAVGADPLMGDGAGLLTHIPHQLFAEEMAAQGVTLPRRNCEVRHRR